MHVIKAAGHIYRLRPTILHELPHSSDPALTAVDVDYSASQNVWCVCVCPFLFF